MILFLLTIAIPCPHNVFEAGPQILAAELTVFQCIPAGLPKLHHEQRGRDFENLSINRQMPLPPLLRTLQLHLTVLRFLEIEPEKTCNLLQLRHYARRRLSRSEPRLLLLHHIIEQVREIEPWREGNYVKGVQAGRLGGGEGRVNIFQLTDIDIVVGLRALEAPAEPRNLHELRNSDPCLGVRVQEPEDQTSDFRGKPGRALEIPLVNLFIHHHQIRVLERQVAHEEHKQNNPTGPDVGLGSVVALLGNHLRRNVRRRAARRVEKAVLPELLRQRAEAEVGDLHISIFV